MPPIKINVTAATPAACVQSSDSTNAPMPMPKRPPAPNPGSTFSPGKPPRQHAAHANANRQTRHQETRMLGVRMQRFRAKQQQQNLQQRAQKPEISCAQNGDQQIAVRQRAQQSRESNRQPDSTSSPLRHSDRRARHAECPSPFPQSRQQSGQANVSRLMFPSSTSKPPPTVPKMMATNVLISSSPFARAKCFSPTSSGTMPYFAGLKKAACVAVKNNTASIQFTFQLRSAKQGKTIAAISIAFVNSTTLRFSNRSASWPAYVAKIRKGATKMKFASSK